MTFYTEIASGELTKKEHNAFAWISPDEVNNYVYCAADEKMLSGTDM